MSTRVLVAGGTGRLGTLVVRRLVARGLTVRVLTRDPHRAAHLADVGVEVIVGDVRDPVSTKAAVSDTDVVVSAVHGFAGPGGGSPATVDRDGNVHLIQAASEVGAQVVLMSGVGAAADSPFELFRMKYAAEAYLTAIGGPSTIVRPTAFLEVWVDLLNGTAGRSNRPLVFGRGKNPVNFVSVRDVAALVDRVVTDQTTRGQTLEIGGPDNLTMAELARIVAESRGGSAGPRCVPRTVLSAMAGTVGRLRPSLGRQLRAALVIDQYDLTFGSSPDDARARFPDLPRTSVTQVLGAPTHSMNVVGESGVR